MIPIDTIASSGLEYADELITLAERAKTLLDDNSLSIAEGWLSYGNIGYILAIFNFRINRTKEDDPEYVWVVVGDLPPALFFADQEIHDNRSVLHNYIVEMQEWVERVLSDRELDDDVIPVNVPPDKEWAVELQGRLEFIRGDIMDDASA